MAQQVLKQEESILGTLSRKEELKVAGRLLDNSIYISNRMGTIPFILFDNKQDIRERMGRIKRDLNKLVG